MTPSKTAPGVPGKHGYLVKNPAFLTALRLIDHLPWPITFSHPADRPPRRLLLSSFGHLGDCVIASATLELVKKLLPDTEIGMIVGSWSAEVFRGDPRVSWLHIVDHWRLDRKKRSLREKLAQYRQTRRTALRDIRSIDYDVAIDLYYFFPSVAPLFWQAGIPKRIGYRSGGFGRFLTHPHSWVAADQHVALYQARLLADLGTPPADLAAALHDLRMVLAPSAAPPQPSDYVIIHMGTGAVEREWPEERWRTVVTGLAERGVPVVLTGRGATEAARCARIAACVPGVTDRCDALDWQSLLDTIAAARLLIGVNSLSGHLAAAYDVPTITIWAGVVNPAQWRPLGDHATILHSAPPCLPCYEWRGCADMACIRDVQPATVLAAAFGRLGMK